MTIVAVGKSSFLARETAKHPATAGWRFLGHDEALAHPGWLDNATAVINFAFPPYFKTQTYDTQSDVDSFLAKMIGERPVHYIMLSSRMVYGQSDNGFNLSEDRAPMPTNAYGTSKLTVERALESILSPERLTILRLSNIFGFEKGRGSFFGRMMTALADSGKISFDMGADTQRDFLAVDRLADALTKTAAQPAPGVFNLGAGFSAKCGDIAAWLTEGYGGGTLEITDPALRDQFSLDVAKARKTWDLPAITPAQLRADVKTCGEMLRAASPI